MTSTHDSDSLDDHPDGQRSLIPASPQTRTNRRRRAIIVITAIGVAAVVIGGGTEAGHLVSGRQDDPRAAVPAATSQQERSPVAIATLVAPAPETTPPAGPWTWCDTSRTYANACKSFSEDSCDAAFAATADGSLLDAFIENKASVDPNRLKDCPQFLPAWRQAQSGFTDGSYQVGKEIIAGTYETTAHLSGGRVARCYWERSGRNGAIINNDFVTATTKIRVTVRPSDVFFVSKGCGNWIKV